MGGGKDAWGMGRETCSIATWSAGIIIPDAGCPDAGFMGEPIFRCYVGEPTSFGAMLYHAMIYYTMIYYAMNYYAMIYHAMIYHAMVHYAMICYAMIYYATIHHAMIYHAMMYYAMTKVLFSMPMKEKYF